MTRVFELGDNDFKPLIHDVVKTSTILLVTEILLFFFNKDPILDKIFVRMTLYTLAGTIVFHTIGDKIIGSGPTCCHLMK
jgi:type IV secretory pathway TrbL component